jgi:hypothetical protein
MSRSVTQRAMTIVSKATLAEGLQRVGFRQVGDHLHRASSDVFHCYHFQASQWGRASSGQFTVNLRVTSELVYEGWTGRRLPKNPATAAFPVQQRIGHLMPAGRDHWWRVDEETDTAQLAAEVSDALIRHGLPFFEAYPDTASMLARLRAGEMLPGLPDSQGTLVHAILAWNLGAPDEAADVLRTAVREARGSPFFAAVQRTLTRLGVPGFDDLDA